MYILEAMRPHPRLTLSRLLACLLLAWTAIDLAVPSLCALEDELRTVSVAGQAVAPSSDAAPDAQPSHVDDCFCCSHCVDVKPATRPLGVSAVTTNVSALVEQAPRLDGDPLYHPPRT